MQQNKPIYEQKQTSPLPGGWAERQIYDESHRELRCLENMSSRPDQMVQQLRRLALKECLSSVPHANKESSQ